MKRNRQVWIEPTTFFTSVQPEECTRTQPSRLVLYLHLEGEQGIALPEEKLSLLLAHLGVYLLSNLQSSKEANPKGHRASVRHQALHRSSPPKQRQGASETHLPDNIQLTQARLVKTQSISLGVSNRNQHIQIENDCPRASFNLAPSEYQSKSKGGSHRRHWSNFTTRHRDTNSEFILEVAAFSYGGVLFELADSVSFSSLVKLSWEGRVSAQEYRSKVLKLLLKLSKCLYQYTSTEETDSLALWREFIVEKFPLILDCLHKSLGRAALCDMFRQFVIQSSFNDLTTERGEGAGESLKGQLLKSAASWEEAVDSLNKTVKRPQLQTSASLETVLESLLIGMFASISNDPAKKEVFYSGRKDQRGHLDFNSLLELMMNFLLHEFNSSFKYSLSLEDLKSKMKGLNDHRGLEAFKISGDLHILHGLLFPKPAPDIVIYQARAPPMKAFRSALEPPIEKSIDLSQRSKSRDISRGLNCSLDKTNTKAKGVPQIPSISRLSRDSHKVPPPPVNSALDTPHMSSKAPYQAHPPSCTPTPPPSSPRQRCNTSSRPFVLPADPQTAFDDIKTNKDELSYASYFDDNWHTKRNDIKELLLARIELMEYSQDPSFRSKVLTLIKHEVSPVIVSATKRLIGLGSDKEVHSIILREYQERNHFKHTWIDKKNKEFHYDVFKALLAGITNVRLTGVVKAVKYLFLHEDRFLMGSYEVALEGALFGRGRGVTAALNELGDNLLCMSSLLRDKSNKYLLPEHRRAPFTGSYVDDQNILSILAPDLTSPDLKGLKRTLYFNQSGLLHNLYLRFDPDNPSESELTRKELMSRVSKYAHMYEDYY